jgi:hypothetical protein
MPPQPERHIAVEVIRAALGVIWLPFQWLAWLPVRAWSSLRQLQIGADNSSARCARFDSAKWTLELLKHLEWRRFEELCAAYLEARGLDPSVVVHCRAWSPYPVAVKPLQELREAMIAAGAGEGVLVSCGRFTQAAVVYAEKEKIELIDGPRFLRELAGLAPETAMALLKLATTGDFLTPTCPACSIKMTSRKSTGEGRAFWGCLNYPRCKQTFSSTANLPA